MADAEHFEDQPLSAPAVLVHRFDLVKEIGILLLNNQRQNRTLHIKKDVLPYALC